jgi:hypothetical protein
MPPRGSSHAVWAERIELIDDGAAEALTQRFEMLGEFARVGGFGLGWLVRVRNVR